MKILFVAPSSNLPNLQTGIELARVASGNEISVADGMVDRTKLELALRDGQFDIVHFAQHGNRAGLELTDGILEVADLVSMMEVQKRLRLLFVNACNSAGTGIVLHNALHTPIITHDATIDDAAAVAFAETFYRALRNVSIDDAFQRALRTLQVRFPSDARTPQLIDGDMVSQVCLAELRKEMKDAFEHFNARLDQMEAAVMALNNGRNHRLQMAMILLLIILIVAQLVTPVLNSLLIHF